MIPDHFDPIGTKAPIFLVAQIPVNDWTECESAKPSPSFFAVQKPAQFFRLPLPLFPRTAQFRKQIIDL
jgi:hypothetical protein